VLVAHGATAVGKFPKLTTREALRILTPLSRTGPARLSGLLLLSALAGGCLVGEAPPEDGYCCADFDDDGPDAGLASESAAFADDFPDGAATDEVAPTELAPTGPATGTDSGRVLAICQLGTPGVYTPFAVTGTYPTGTVAQYPWRGKIASSGTVPYPNGLEDFRGYGTNLPNEVECGADKYRRSHLDVTAGCLRAVATGGGAYTRGHIEQTSDGYFRTLALAYSPAEQTLPVKWTDQAIEYRFLHGGRTGSSGNPGFKAFVRYRSEDDLYVASWRFDGVVQIQRKQCGVYTALAVRTGYPPPSANVWHSLRFQAVGSELKLWLDGKLVLTTSASAFAWGTAGIRIDSANGTYLDDWRVFQP
jgi:hypothetical protein